MPFFEGVRTGHGRRSVSSDSLLLDHHIRDFVSGQQQNLEASSSEAIELNDQNQDRASLTRFREDEDNIENNKLQSPHDEATPFEDDRDGMYSTITSWVPEIFSVLVASCCLIAIFIILAKFNGQLQPDWPYASTLNLSTLIALIATILRSTLAFVIDSVIGQMKWRSYQSSPRPLNNLAMFDGASRGSWGSIKFLFTLFRLNLATLGALIMVFSVVIGTFTQQALRTISCRKVDLQGLASMPIAQGGSSLQGLQKTSPNDGLYELNTDLRASIIAALTGMQSSNSLSPTCTSGNCTFKATNGITYSSSAFSTECVDVSSLITQSGRRSWDTANNYSVETATSYSLSNGLSISYYLSTQDWDSHGGRWDTMLVATNALYSENGSLSFDNVTMTPRQQEIFNVSFDGVVFLMPTTSPCENISDYQTFLGDREMYAMPPIRANSCSQLNLPKVNTLPGYFSVTAAACFFYQSLQHYNGSVVNGQLEETVQDTTPLKAASTFEEVAGMNLWRYEFSEPCVVDGAVYTNASSNLSSVPGGLITYSNITAPKRCFYGFSYYWYRALEVQASLYSIIVPSETDTCVQFANYTSIMCTKNWWLSGIFNGGNATTASINSFMAAGFTSLTNQFRTTGTDWDNNISIVSGMAYQTDICTQFRWEWMIYPLAMVLGTLILLCSTVITGWLGIGHRRKHETVWKSSILPLLFYSLDNQEQKRNSSLSSEKQLRKEAKAIKVGFTSGEDGWKFRPTE